MALSIPELEAKDRITTEELVETITDYANGNKAIVARVVIDLTRRVGWDTRSHMRAVKCLRSAVKMHRESGRVKEAHEYHQVLQYLSWL